MKITKRSQIIEENQGVSKFEARKMGSAAFVRASHPMTESAGTKPLLDNVEQWPERCAKTSR
jgi:hypothetical protein